MLSKSEVARYGRQISLPGIGIKGQERLKRSKVLIIGAGGLGCPSMMYLAAAGVGTIGVVDFDVVDESNLHRQVVFNSTSVGRPKVMEAKERLLAMNPRVQVDIYRERLSSENAKKIVSNYDIVIDGSDNFPTKYLVNDVCIVLDKPFISGSIFKFQGQVSLFNAVSESARGPTYRCLFPVPPSPDTVPPCAEIGVLGVLPGLVGVIQAAETIKYLVELGVSLSGRLLIVDALSMDFRSITFSRNEEIVKSTRILSDNEYFIFCNGNRMEAIKQMEAAELKRKIDRGERFHLIDVREPFEKEICDIGGDLIPLSTLRSSVDRIPRDEPVVVYCKSGGRSGRAVELLQKEFGFNNVYNLKGGILGWIDQVDKSLRTY